jgi:hypothetical protein
LQVSGDVDLLRRSKGSRSCEKLLFKTSVIDNEGFALCETERDMEGFAVGFFDKCSAEPNRLEHKLDACRQLDEKAAPLERLSISFLCDFLVLTIAIA